VAAVVRIFVDECLPKQLKIWLANKHKTITVQEPGWANIKNGKLLRLANDAAFDVFITADKNYVLSAKLCWPSRLSSGYPE
jgi:predicted nuclease of predicted toxin-antitoxin system